MKLNSLKSNLIYLRKTILQNNHLNVLTFYSWVKSVAQETSLGGVMLGTLWSHFRPPNWDAPPDGLQRGAGLRPQALHWPVGGIVHEPSRVDHPAHLGPCYSQGGQQGGYPVHVEQHADGSGAEGRKRTLTNRQKIFVEVFDMHGVDLSSNII